MIRASFLLPLAFFASGAAALLFEVLWFRAFGRVLGNTVWAAALVLTAFMLGLALGGLLAARWAERIRRPALAFAAAEAVVAVSGSLLVWGLPLVEAPVGHLLSPLAERPALTAGLRLALAFFAMLVPAIAMGMTLPLGVRVLARQETTRALGVLYAANTFGACLAPALAEFYLIEALGLRGTALVAAALNLAAVALAVRLPAPAPSAAVDAGEPRWEPRLLVAAALSGGLALALEVVWFRILLLHAPGTDATFALLLLLMLAGLALGGLLAPLLARAGFAWAAAAGGICVIAGYALTVPGGGALGGRPVVGDVLLHALVLMMPPAVLSGALFTLLGAQLRGSHENPQPAIGRLTFANTLGAALGAALGGFALLPRLGAETSLFLLAAGYALLPLLFVGRGAWRPAIPAAVLAAALLFFPFGHMQRHLDQAVGLFKAVDRAVVARVVEGPTTTLQLLRTDRFGEPAAWRLVTDSYSMSAVDREALRYMQLFAWLPLSLHPEPRQALLISYGAGSTARALLDDDGLRRLTIVDLSPEILGVSRLIHGEGDPLTDPRVRLVVEDGRHYLRTRQERFDLITAEPPPPAAAGVVNLYTQEYFAALAERLAPGGLATYWLPVKQFQPAGARAVVAAFCAVFPDCTLWSGAGYEWILMGGRDFHHRAALQGLARLWEQPQSRARLVASGFEHPAQLGATFLADAGQLRRWAGTAPPVTDDHPKRMDVAFPLVPPLEEYLRLLEPQAAAANFRASGWIAAHWPAELADPVQRAYSVQRVLNGEIEVAPSQRVEAVDALLRHSGLVTPVLWLLGSDATEQQIIERQFAAGKRDPAFAYPLGVRSLARRDYKRAAPLLVEAATREPARTAGIAAYAACGAGQPAQARAARDADLLPVKLRCWR